MIRGGCTSIPCTRDKGRVMRGGLVITCKVHSFLCVGEFWTIVNVAAKMYSQHIIVGFDTHIYIAMDCYDIFLLVLYHTYKFGLY